MRPRRKGRQSASGEASGHTPNSPTAQNTPDPAGRGRPAHVRSRLIVAVAVVAAAIAGAGAPSVITASGELNDSQNLVTLAERTQDAVALSHSLADERDEVTSYIAAGRPDGKGPSEERSARVDRQVEELRTEATETDAPASFRKTLDGIATVRRAALTGKSTALEAHRAYSATLAELHGLAEELAERIPPRAGAGAHSLADLDTAVQQAAATRGLLLAALNVPTTTTTTTDPITGLPTTSTSSSAAGTKERDALTAAAQQAGVREQAALAGFRETAPKADRASYDSTVTGAEVTTAEKYLANLAGRPTLSDSQLDTDTKKLDAALSARIEQMRGVEASLNTERAEDLAQVRDDDVTALEIRIAILGALMLLAVGVATGMARSLTRPLAVLRLGSARLAAAPGTEEPVRFTGRDDEFAQVVRSVNALHAHALALHERLAPLEGERKHLIGQRQKMADERDRLRAELADATAHLTQVRTSIHGTFVNLALRTLGLVERQLGVIEGLEEREQDPDRLATLFRLDHFATVMRRHSENLLVLAGADHGHQHPGPVPLVDVVRAAVSEIERYERVRIAALPPHAHLAGFAADDISHLVAELLENASSFSPPDLPVEVSGWLMESGEVMLSVQDEGIGMTGDKLTRLNARLSDFDPEDAYDQESGEGLGLGLYVVARLAHRHGVRVRLREQKQGGVTAVVVLPKSLLAAAPAVAVPSATVRTSGGAAAMSLPGADAEVNSNVLHTRTDRDPLIAAAEHSLRGPTGQGADPTPSAVPTSPALDASGQEPAGPDSAGPGSTAPDPVGPGSAVPGSPASGPAGPTFTTSDSAGSTSRVPDFEGATSTVPGSAGSTSRVPDFEGATSTVPGSAESGSTVPHPARSASTVQGSADPDSAGSGSTAPEPAEPASTVPAPDGPTSQVLGSAGRGSVASVSAAEGFDEPGLAEPDSAEQGTATAAETVRGEGSAAEAARGDGRGSADTHAETPTAARPADYAEQPEDAQASEPSAPHEPHEASVPSGPETTMVLMAPVPPARESSEAAAASPPAEGEAREPGSGDGPAVTLPAQTSADPFAGGPVTTDPYAIGPDTHERVPDEPHAPRPAHASYEPQEPNGSNDSNEPVTDKGLPKRTPKISAPPQSARPRRASVDAEALRRRLGGFHRGANDGRRDVEAEIAEQTSELQQPAAHAVETKGDTVEEASS